jgi:hypothetical protein
LAARRGAAGWRTAGRDGARPVQVGDAGFFEAGAEPRDIGDEELYGRLKSEFPSWLGDARDAGIVH